MPEFSPGIQARLALEMMFLDIEYRSLIYWNYPGKERVHEPRAQWTEQEKESTVSDNTE